MGRVNHLSMDDRPSLYAAYAAFKHWEDDSTADVDHHHRWLLKLAGKPGAVELLDIGFGRAGMLDWAKTHGHATHGVEIIPEFLARAKARGHDVRTDLSGFRDGQFDVITAVDVLEHLSQEQCVAMLGEVR